MKENKTGIDQNSGRIEMNSSRVLYMWLNGLFYLVLHLKIHNYKNY